MATIVSMPSSVKSTQQTVEAGRRLADTRLALGLTQEQLAEEIGVTRGALANWEQGSRFPDVAAMMRLYHRRRVPLDWIYIGNPAALPYELADRLLAGNKQNPPSARRRAG